MLLTSIVSLIFTAKHMVNSSSANNQHQSSFTNHETAPTVGGFLHLTGVIYRCTPHFPGKWRFLKWCFRSWLKGRRTDVIRLNEHIVMLCNFCSDYGVWSLGDKYEKHEADYFISILQPGMTFFDVGANVGYYSLLAAPLLKGKGEIHSFEPVSAMHSMLSQNFKQNNINNAFPVRMIVSDSPGQKTIHLAPEDNCGSSSTGFVQRSDHLTETVPCTTLDDYIGERKVGRVDVVKIDAEGEEVAVIKGAVSMLRQKRPILMIEVRDRLLQHSGTSRKELYSLLKEIGYGAFTIKPSARLEPINTECDGALIVFKPVESGSHS